MPNKTLNLQNLTKKQLQEQVMVMTTALLDRTQLAARAGMQYNKERDVYKALGYERTENLNYAKYYAQYDRHDMAKAIIDRPIKATWRGGVTLLESDDDEKTPLEKAWLELYDKFSLYSKFVRVDKLSGIGKYGILLLGFNDVNKKEDFIKPVETGKRELLYVKPLSEASAIIDKWETNPSDERFGFPTIYKVKLVNPGSNSSNITEIRVHYSRVIHITGELLESEVEGTPRLKVVYNRLQDLEKLIGGSAEMFWRGARPGYQGIVDKDFQGINTSGLQDQFDEFEHNLRRYMINAGIEMKALDQQIADPKSQVHVVLQMISAVTEIPLRVLIGSERGELASSQDEKAWKESTQARRDEFAEPIIVRAFTDKCIKHGVLPAAGENGYIVVWTDLFAPSEKEKAEVGKIRAEALAAYGRNPGVEIFIPPKAFNKFFLGLKDEDIRIIEEIAKEAVTEETDDFGEE